MKFSKPLYNIWHITTHHGDMVLYGTRYRPHKGLDLRTKNKHFPTGIGQPLYASANGKVVLKGYNDKAGNMLILDHGEGYRTRYYHLSSYVVSTGTYVKEGDLIAYCGNSGKWTTGGHLHWEVRINGVAVDPLKYLKNDESNNDIFNGMFKNEDELNAWLAREGYVKKDPDLFQDSVGGVWRCKNNKRYKLGSNEDDFVMMDARFVTGPLNDDHKKWPITTTRKDVY